MEEERSPTKMGPEDPLPYDTSAFPNVDSYIDSLLHFVGNHDLLRTLCGGVHILDSFTTDPDLYAELLPREWREFFADHEPMDLLDLFMREPLDQFHVASGGDPSESGALINWRGGPSLPASLIEYIENVRKHLLCRAPKKTQCARNRAMKPTQKLARQVIVGMTVKKVHEVGVFASYIDDLSADVSARTGHEISHLVDFGSGQSYLGRALASEPYNKSIVAIESKTRNAERAKFYDVKARLVEKEKVMRNKKAYRSGLVPPDSVSTPKALPTPPPEPDVADVQGPASHGRKLTDENGGIEEVQAGIGTIQHIEHRIHSGDLSEVIARISNSQGKANLMVTSLHSCGNLIHHGLRSLMLNPSVKVVAMVGCCYNLLTERLGPATYKLPGLRPTRHGHPRLDKEGEAHDPDGFPMSQRFCGYGSEEDDRGVRLNITARMMAVQAPANWGESDSERFFTRHFYRALLQRVFLDRGVVGPPDSEFVGGVSPAGCSLGTPIVIGSLRKTCYAEFVTYVRAALVKLYDDPVWGASMTEKMSGITDAEIGNYERRFKHRKKDLSVIWSLMAFSAGAIEAAIVVDRYLWLKEQKEVCEAWVEPVFDYRMSPRNLVVVGVKG